MTNLVDINFADAEKRVMARIQEVVDTALDNAVENGHEELVIRGKIAVLVEDMLDCDADVAKLREELIVEDADPVIWLRPFIMDWRKRKASK